MLILAVALGMVLGVTPPTGAHAGERSAVTPWIDLALQGIDELLETCELVRAH